MASDPLFVGLTRPAMLAGVTLTGIVLNGMLCAIPFILFKSFIFLAMFIPLHGIMWIVCRWDVRFFDLIILWLKTSAQARFVDLWHGASYRQ